MENASKALIIAGAILISIVIITLGMVIVRNVTGTINTNSNLSTQEIESFNSRFLIYEGNNVPGSQVNALIQAVYQQDVAAIRDNTGQYICILEYPSVDGTVNQLIASDICGPTPIVASTDESKDSTSTKVSIGKTYKVTMSLSSNTGLVSEITVETN